MGGKRVSFAWTGEGRRMICPSGDTATRKIQDIARLTSWRLVNAEEAAVYLP